MNIYVLYDQSGLHSGRALGEALHIKLGKNHVVSKGRPSRFEYLNSKGFKYNYIINAGWYREIAPSESVVINNPANVRKASNKKEARLNFRKSGVPSPSVWLSADNIPSYEYPVIARPNHHSRGQGFWLCSNIIDAKKATIAGATHFIKLIPNTREFRIHILVNKIDLTNLTLENFKTIKISEKVSGESGVKNNLIKNHENGWIFSYPKDKNNSLIKSARDVAKKALLSTGLHWGAVDVIISKDTGEAYVLEVNTTPCLTDETSNTLEKYVDGFCNLLSVE